MNWQTLKTFFFRGQIVRVQQATLALVFPTGPVWSGPDWQGKARK